MCDSVGLYAERAIFCPSIYLSVTPVDQSKTVKFGLCNFHLTVSKTPSLIDVYVSLFANGKINCKIVEPILMTVDKNSEVSDTEVKILFHYCTQNL